MNTVELQKTLRAAAARLQKAAELWETASHPEVEEVAEALEDLATQVGTEGVLK